MADREFFPCYHSYFKKCEKLTDQELGRLFRALMMYSSTGERQELAGRESIAFDFIADDIDEDKKSYTDMCEKRLVSGKKGGRPKKQMISGKVNGFEESKRFLEKQMVSEESKNGCGTPPPAPPSPSPSSPPPHPPIITPIPNPPISPLPHFAAAAAGVDAREGAGLARPVVPTDPSIAAVFSAYDEKLQKGSPLTGKIRDELMRFLDLMGPECCIRAMDEAVEAGAVNWRYTRKILEDKQSNGVRRIADWDALESKRKVGSSDPGTGQKSWAELARELEGE